MIITKKEKKNYLYGGIVLVIIGGGVLLYLIQTRGSAGDFLTVFGKLASLIGVIIGVVYLVQYNKLYQDKDVKLDIKNDMLTFEGENYSLKDGILSSQFTTTPKKDMYRVTLYLEQENKVKKIFEHIVFDLNEMTEFLKLIKPYRKTQVCLVSTNPYKIELFEGGFTYEGREILYDEVEKFDTIFIDASGTTYLDIEIILKNGDKIQTRLINGIEEYARAKYASLLSQSNGKRVPQITCVNSNFGTVITITDIIIIVLNYFYDCNIFKFFGIAMVIITFLYLLFNTSDVNKLCEGVRKIQKKMDKN